MAVYSNAGGVFTLMEQPVYGAGRIGIAYNGANYTKTYIYELTDHLGNVRAVFTKNNNDANLEGYTDYYPGGMAMPNRNLEDANAYRYGYQGQFAEEDKETGLYAFQLRMYDPRINRWLSPDPYGQHASPYMSMGNSWANNVDPDGGMDCPDPPCNNDVSAAIILDEVTVVGVKTRNVSPISWTTEMQRYGFNGTIEDWKREFGVRGDNNSVRAWYQDNYGSEWAQQVGQWDKEEQNRRLLAKLGYFTAHFKAIEDVAKVLPASRISSTFNTANTLARSFSYTPRYIGLRGRLLDNLHLARDEAYFAQDDVHRVWSKTAYDNVIKHGRMTIRSNGTYGFEYRGQLGRYELGVRPDGGITHNNFFRYESSFRWWK
jgi:RHS repeat-associated protein